MITSEQIRKFSPAVRPEVADKIAYYFEQFAPQYEVNTPERIQAFFANGAHESAGFTRFEENLNYSSDGLIKTFGKYFVPEEKDFPALEDKARALAKRNRTQDGRELALLIKAKQQEIAAVYARKPILIANRVYANRNGNGPENSGDGWRYRGRGIFQLTGKDNYRKLSRHLYEDNKLSSPLPHEDWLLEQPEIVGFPLMAVRSALYYWGSHNLNIYADKNHFQALAIAINGGTNGMADRLQWLEKAKKIFP